ncbi:hypothetical protein EJ06DRAFT_553703 [Trichodelitschia bisporula]|uniref:Uncharacterized protein n=1 Tax=Trichodelitschia bisporula TaxID=703511 RepID=A0A6G1I5P0_9PEZI|nr:hypothetical protein EJ06DRAFT_553703 [Trichodelitschia bisporula]
MCEIIIHKYISPSGQRSSREEKRLCGLSDDVNPCMYHTRREITEPLDPHPPSLVHDDSPSSVSVSIPGTPISATSSARYEVREPRPLDLGQGKKRRDSFRRRESAASSRRPSPRSFYSAGTDEERDSGVIDDTPSSRPGPPSPTPTPRLRRKAGYPAIVRQPEPPRTLAPPTDPGHRRTRTAPEPIPFSDREFARSQAREDLRKQNKQRERELEDERRKREAAAKKEEEERKLDEQARRDYERVEGRAEIREMARRRREMEDAKARAGEQATAQANAQAAAKARQAEAEALARAQMEAKARARRLDDLKAQAEEQRRRAEADERRARLEREARDREIARQAEAQRVRDEEMRREQSRRVDELRRAEEARREQLIDEAVEKVRRERAAEAAAELEARSRQASRERRAARERAAVLERDLRAQEEEEMKVRRREAERLQAEIEELERAQAVEDRRLRGEERLRAEERLRQEERARLGRRPRMAPPPLAASPLPLRLAAPQRSPVNVLGGNPLASQDFLRSLGESVLQRERNVASTRAQVASQALQPYVAPTGYGGAYAGEGTGYGAAPGIVRRNTIGGPGSRVREARYREGRRMQEWPDYDARY